jgi:iron complex outermembrane receptor protein
LVFPFSPAIEYSEKPTEQKQSRRHFLRKLPSSLASLAFSFFPVAYAFAAEAPSRELLLFMEVPTVVTPARREQPLTKAPSTTTIITAEEIARSGATSIPDLFRSVPGLDFMRTTASDVNITARGLNSRLAHRMQVFVDGRSVNGDFFNLVFWHEIPISLNEIDRIEIIRSPSSALFGAVAFSGVIHIITKSPKDLAGTHISETAGSAGVNVTNVIHAGVTDNWAYKVSYEYDRANHFPNPPIGRSHDDLGREDFRGNAFAEYKFSDSSRASISAGIDSFDRDIDPGLGLDFGRFIAQGGLGFVKLNYSLGDLKLQSVYDRLQFDLTSKNLSKTVAVRADGFKLEGQHSVKLGDQNVLTGGAGYRFSVFDAPLLTGAKREQHFFDAFLQDEYSPMENLTFTLGLRVETHPEAGVHASPRGSIVYTPWENHTFRVSISRAFRNPSVIENFVNFAINPKPPLPITVTVLGDRNLKAEEITSYELGYQTLLSQRVKARIDLFYNTLDKMTLGPVPPKGCPSPCPTSNLSTGGGGAIFGGEISFEFLLAEWLKGFMNYSYEKREFNDGRLLLGVAPNHKGNVGLNFTLPKGFEADVLVNAVGRSDGISGNVAPYTLVNLHLGYPFQLLGTKGKLDFSVFDLFNDRHREIHGGDIIERRITGGVHISF